MFEYVLGISIVFIASLLLLWPFVTEKKDAHLARQSLWDETERRYV